MHAFDVLGDPVRRVILELLATGEHSSGEIGRSCAARFGITQSAVSQQLRILRDSGFASVRADGARRNLRRAVRPASRESTAGSTNSGRPGCRVSTR